MRLYLLALILLIGNSLPLLAQDDELQRGLIATFRDEYGATQQVFEDIAFDWGKFGPDGFSRTEESPWQGSWQGQILIRSLTPYRFFAQISGQLRVLVDGELVLETDSDKSQWISGQSVQISPGFRDIEVNYTPTASQAELKLFWESEEFAVEPIPAHLLFHEEESQQARQKQLGGELFDAFRCANCHRSSETLDDGFPAPALWGSVSGTNPEWIVNKLLGTHPEAQHDRMPNFGLTRDQAEDIAAYLHRLEAPFDLMTSPKVENKKGKPDGALLFHSMGCLACHEKDGLGTSNPYSGGSLSQIENKRSKDWIATWLAVPDRLNPQHRMPAFQLSRSERGALADYLSSVGRKSETKFGTPSPRPTSEQADRGRELVHKLQCSNCHKIPAIEASATPAIALNSPNIDWEQSCLAAPADVEKHRPHYKTLDVEPIRAFVESTMTLSGTPESTFHHGQQVLSRSQCLACHSRGSVSGIRTIANDIATKFPKLVGRTQEIIPPSLNAIGDKLRDDVLDSALSGKQDRVRADWLMVRMPQFNHSPEQLDALKTFLVEHDRIPEGGATHMDDVAIDRDELLLTGRNLVGAGGFSCIACHQIGDYVPKNTAIGTRGSDLSAIGSRLRPEFYLRWTRAPLRVIPGMEMPSYTKPVPGILDGHVETQLTALWKAVTDAEFEPPSNPAQVEQLWQVAGESAPRIIRDVFTLPKEFGEESDDFVPVARAFAVGFPNHHSVLFDLDRAEVRDWRFGDFARQRTEGKSWYWDMAGTSFAPGWKSVPDFVLVNQNSESIEPLQRVDSDRLAHLVQYETEGAGVRLVYDLNFLFNDAPFVIRVEEKFEPTRDSGSVGWTREITSGETPDGYQLGLLIQNDLDLRYDASIQVADQSALALKTPQEDVYSAQPGVPLKVHYSTPRNVQLIEYPDRPQVLASTAPVITVPGYSGKRLPVTTSMMPTAIWRDAEGNLIVASLKGDVWRITDSDHDRLEDQASLVEEGLSAAFGVLRDGNDLLVVHKPELLRLIDTNGDGRADVREIITDGWGHTDNYHDWVTGPVRGSNGELFVATGSDYSQPERDPNYSKWRGSIIRSGSDGTKERFASELRYPIGIAFDGQGRLFVSDQQGVQNTFNEINHIVEGGAYGVPARSDLAGVDNPRKATIQVPHPWTRSVNGIFFLPEGIASPFAGHGLGCEYNSKFLIRFTTQEVGGELQGACYPFSKATWKTELDTFLGPICGYADEDGTIYVGSIFDSGWLGGPNVGEIVQLNPTEQPGNGIRELRLTSDGFEIEFIAPVEPETATEKTAYSLSGYTRVWQGSYGTEDSGRYTPPINGIELSDDHKVVTLRIADLRPEFVYELNVDFGEEETTGEGLFPSFAAYTINKLVDESNKNAED
ncbi:Cytochrome c [Thalassoglobus neptunius]|uniref:Cytochrome c n=1 Tax=Thalassoglobus neptunius TaxID=1938619 RepID=A0A5C5X6H2_9PLAN|nr:c-type cytochrome [Thalassoglobus neptunius]TWT57863.1 Cytochrome c [Thalassoglobus neptunius]